MLSLALEDQLPILKTIKDDLENSRQAALEQILSQTLMPTKHRDHFARAIEAYTLQIKFCRKLLEEASFNATVLENIRVEYFLDVQKDALARLEDVQGDALATLETGTQAPSEETTAIFNADLEWHPEKRPSAVQEALEALRESEPEIPFAQEKIVCCIKLLNQESFDAVFLERIHTEYQLELKELFEELSESFKEQIKHKDQTYDPHTKCWIDTRSAEIKERLFDSFKQKIFETELPMYQTWKPALSPQAVLEDKTHIEYKLEDTFTACSVLSEELMNELSSQTQIHDETRKAIAFQFHQQNNILKRLTFNIREEPYYNLVKQGSIGLLKRRFTQDKLTHKDRQTFLKNHAPEVLHIACANNQLNMLHFLIGTLRMPQLRNEAGYYPIHYAVVGSREGERPDCLIYLLRKGADVNARGPFAYTPLHVAVMYNRLDLVQLLCQHKANVNGLVEKRHHHLKPIHLAAVANTIDILSFLLAQGANPFFLNQERHSPLVEAVLEDKKETVMIFFRHGIWLNAADRCTLEEYLTKDESSETHSGNLQSIQACMDLEAQLVVDEHDRLVLTRACNENPLSLANYMKPIWHEFNILTTRAKIYAIQQKYALALLSSESLDPQVIADLEKEYGIMIRAIPILAESGFYFSDEDHRKRHEQWRLPCIPNEARKLMRDHEKDRDEIVMVRRRKIKYPSFDSQELSSLDYETHENTADPYEAIQYHSLKRLLDGKNFSPRVIEDAEEVFHADLQSLNMTIALPEEPDLDMTFNRDLTPTKVFYLLETREDKLKLTQEHCDKLSAVARELHYAFELGTPESLLVEKQTERETAQDRHPDYYRIFNLCFNEDLQGLDRWNVDWRNILLKVCPNALHIACTKNNLVLATSLLQTLGRTAMLPDEYGRYPIHYAMLLKGDARYDSIGQLMLKGADINARDHCLWTPLHVACLQDDLALVKFLLSKGASLKGTQPGYETPLHVAASRNKPTMVTYLLEQEKNDVSALNQNGHTPLVSAILLGHLDIAKLFLQHGYWLGIQDKAILVAHLDTLSTMVLDDAVKAITFKSISRCVTLERKVMALIGYTLSPHATLDEGYEALVPPPVSPDLERQTPSCVPDPVMPPQLVLASTSEPSTAVSTREYISYIRSIRTGGVTRLYAAGERILAAVPTPTMPAALQSMPAALQSLHYLYPPAPKPGDLITNSATPTTTPDRSPTP